MKCEHCGTEIRADQQGKRFCSTDCWYAFTKARRTTKCPACGDEFQRAFKTQRACSAKCATQLKRADKQVKCECCGIAFERPHGKARRFCSRRCSMLSRENRGTGKALPEGAHSPHSSGYILVKVNGKWVFEHRHVIEQKIGRTLLPRERVHHKNGDRADNRPENLELWAMKGRSKKDPAGQRWEDLVAALPLRSGMCPAEIRATLLRALVGSES